MDALTVGVVVALLVAGGAFVYWPMSLAVELLQKDLRLALAELKAAREANHAETEAADLVVEGERVIGRARDLDPGERFRVLLSSDLGEEEPPAGEADGPSPSGDLGTDGVVRP